MQSPKVNRGMGALRVWAATLASIALLIVPPATMMRTATALATSVPSYDHIFIIMMENTSYSQIVGSANAPYINSLIAQGASGANYFSVDHPSLPNYLALTSGDTYDSWAGSDCDPGPGCQTSAVNIADEIEASGRTWKAYAESMSSTCNMSSSGSYYARHVPFLYYTQISSSARCNNVVDYSDLSADLSSTTTTPAYAFITPNGCDDMHDCSISTGDTWLSNNVPSILNSPAFTQQHSALIVTWDEDEFTSVNQVAFVAVGYGIRPAMVSTQLYNHYSFLRTLETSWGLGAMTANDRSAATMNDIFGGGLGPTPTPTVSPSPTASASPTPSPTPTPVRRCKSRKNCL